MLVLGANLTYLNFSFFFGCIISYSLYIICYYNHSYWFLKCEMLKQLADPIFDLFQQFIRWKFCLWGWIIVTKEILQRNFSAQNVSQFFLSLITLSSSLVFDSRLLYKVIFFYNWRYMIDVFVSFNDRHQRNPAKWSW